MKINYWVLLLFIIVVNTQLYGQKVKLLDNTYYKAFGDRSDIVNIVENERPQIIMLLEPSLSSMIEETLSTDTALFRCVLIINIERTNNIFNIYKHMKSITCIINYNAIDSCPILTFTKHNISQFILKMR